LACWQRRGSVNGRLISDAFLDILPYNNTYGIDRDTSTPDQLQGGRAID